MADAAIGQFHQHLARLEHRNLQIAKDQRLAKLYQDRTLRLHTLYGQEKGST